MYALPTSFSPFFCAEAVFQPAFTGWEAVGTGTETLYCVPAYGAPFLLLLGPAASRGATPQLSVGFPGAPGAVNKPTWTCPSRRQNSASFPTLRVGVLSRPCSSASCKVCVAIQGSFARQLQRESRSSSPTPPAQKKDSCFINLLVTIPSSTPFSTQH